MMPAYTQPIHIYPEHIHIHVGVQVSKESKSSSNALDGNLPGTGGGWTSNADARNTLGVQGAGQCPNAECILPWLTCPVTSFRKRCPEAMLVWKPSAPPNAPHPLSLPVNLIAARASP